VDEHLLASADRRNSADDQRTRDMGFNLAQGTGTGMNAAINSQNNGHSQDEGQASRTNDLVGSVTARVVGVSPTGLLQIKGTKVVMLDKNSEELTISGWIRSDDVTSGNTIESWRIADAQLAYHATGDMNKPKGNIILRILGAIWP
jgi:flagellar L-ring protein FlgH